MTTAGSKPIEGELRWSPFDQGSSVLDFGAAYLCASGRGRVFREILVAGTPNDFRWSQVEWIMPVADLTRALTKATDTAGDGK